MSLEQYVQHSLAARGRASINDLNTQPDPAPISSISSSE